MAKAHSNSTRKSQRHSRHRFRTSALFTAAIGIGLTGHALGGQSDPPTTQIAPSTTQSNDLLLKMVLEIMLQLLDEIENAQDGEIGMSTPKVTLQEAAEALVWGYANLGIDDELPPLIIVQGIDDCQEALVLIQDPSEPPQLPPVLLNLLETTVEGISDDLEAAL